MVGIKKLIIQGGKPLKGSVQISGAKNAALPIMASTLLLREKVILKNIPDVQDVHTMAHLLSDLGAKVRNKGNGVWEINPENLSMFEAPYEAVRRMRASIYVLGPLLARFGRAKVALPGGCSFGPRPVNFHLEGLKRMGTKIDIEHGFIVADAKKLKGMEMSFDKKSVGATAHLCITAVFGSGETTLINTAQEPEIVDLVNFLKKGGAKIEGEGTDLLKIKGIKKLNSPKEYKIMPDRIEAGTFLIAGCITRGNIEIDRNVSPYLESVLEKLRHTGVQIKYEKKLQISGDTELRSVNIETSPYPGFPTDLQPQMVAFLSTVKGTSIIKEGIYPERFKYVDELMRMGAKISVEQGICVVKGVKKLEGAIVVVPDIRAGAGLILAALSAKGTSEIEGVLHINRGYERFTDKLKKLGAKIEELVIE